MVSISFEKDEYARGEIATIAYKDAPQNGFVFVMDPTGTVVFRGGTRLGGLGSCVYTISTSAPLGEYTVELMEMGVRVATDTMEVVSGAAPPADKGTLKVTTSPTGALVTVDGMSCGTTPVYACELSIGSKTVTITKSGYNTETRNITITAGAPTNLGTITLTPTAAPPAEGETRELDLGDYEVTWTLSGCDTLNAEIRVTDTGVTCLSVTLGACYSATAPGVTISTFNVTGHLKSAVAPPTEGYLTVNTTPTGANVRVGTVSCGTTPVTACALSPGWKEIILTKTGYKPRVLMEEIKAGQFLDLGTITLTPTAAPPVGISSWIDESGVTNLTKDHAVYVFYVSAGAVSAADGKYAKLSPKPSKMDPSVASKDNAIGIFYYSQGAMVAGNGKTGLSY